MTTRLAIAFIWMVAMVASAGVASAQDSATDKARAHYQKGLAHYQAQKYRAAIAEFASADRLSPAPMLEYNIGLCHERLGEKSEAVRRFKQYLKRAPNADDRAEVEAQIERLEAEIARELTPPPKPPERTPAPAPQPDVVPDTGAGPPNPGTDLVPPPEAEGATDETPDGSATGTTSTTTYAPTGDAELDRVAAVDLDAVRNQHVAAGAQTPPQPPPNGAVGGSVTGGGATDGAAMGGPAQGPQPVAPAPADDPPKSKPFYKQWWFWVVAGVGAIILIDIATSDSGGGTQRVLLPTDPRTQAQPGGAVLLRF